LPATDPAGPSGSASRGLAQRKITGPKKGQARLTAARASGYALSMTRMANQR
jgi:hypothetical protein